jgi:L-alanine-DL-glutamate epimerase-like enolase superfamily enzyme
VKFKAGYPHVEQDRADDFAGHARIATECRTPIQMGENLWGPHDLTKSLSAGASDFVMLDVMKIGGITGWLRVVSQAEAAGLPVSSHLFPKLSAQLLAISPHAHWLEYQDGAATIFERPLELKNGSALSAEGRRRWTRGVMTGRNNIDFLRVQLQSLELTLQQLLFVLLHRTQNFLSFCS